MRQLMQVRNLPQLNNSFNGVQNFKRNYVTTKISLYCRPQVIKLTLISSGFVGNDTFTQIIHSNWEGEGRAEVKLWDNTNRGSQWVVLSG